MYLIHWVVLIHVHAHKHCFSSIILKIWKTFLVQFCSCSNFNKLSYYKFIADINCIFPEVFCLHFLIIIYPGICFNFSIVPWKVLISISVDPTFCHVTNCECFFMEICFYIWVTCQMFKIVNLKCITNGA